MKKFITLFCILFPLALLASFVVVYDTSSKRVTGTISSADTLAYMNRTGYLVNPVVPDGMFTNLNNFWVTNNAIEAVPQSVLDAEWLAASNASVVAQIQFRSNLVQSASDYVIGTNDADKLILKAFALLVLDQINTLRQNTNKLAIITTNTFLQSLSNTVKTLNP